MRIRGERWLQLAILAVASGAVLLSAAATGSLLAPGHWEYSAIADDILKGQGGGYPFLETRYYFYGPAVYPLLLAGGLWLTHSETAIVVLQAVLFGLGCLLVFRIARQTAGAGQAGVAAGLAAIHPGAVWYAGQLHSQTLDTVLFLGLFLLLLRLTLDPSQSILKLMGLGLVAGLAALSRGTALPFCALWAAWWCWRQRAHPARAAGHLGVIALGGLLVIAPVLIRGARLYGRLIPLRTDTGANFWSGNHPGASGTSYTVSDHPVPVFYEMDPALAARLAGKNEVEQNALLGAAAVDFIRRDPRAASALFLKKLAYFWWRSPHAGLRYPAAWGAVYQGYYAAILLLALLGLAASLRAPEPAPRVAATLFLVMAAAVSVSQAAFYVEGRHRWQLEPLLLMFSAVGILELIKCLHGFVPTNEAGVLEKGRFSEETVSEKGEPSLP